MKKIAKELLFSPSDLVKFMESPFITWMDRYSLEFTDEIEPDPDDEEMKIVQDRGLEHERKYLEGLGGRGIDVCEVPDTANSRALTLDAMNAGREVIYQAAISADNFSGYADFLQKVEMDSKFGPYGYEVWDTKLARKPKPYFVIQLCCYANILESIQGVRPPEIAVVLGDGTEKRFRTNDFFYYYAQLKAGFLAQQDDFDPERRPAPMAEGNNGRWETIARQWILDHDDLSQLAGISTVQAQRLHSSGIDTVNALAKVETRHIPKMAPDTLGKLRAQARLQVESRGLDRPKFEVIPPSFADGRFGLAGLPPASELDVAFDIEGYPHVDEGLEYLFGATYQENGRLQYRDWWGHDRFAEQKAFEDVIDWVYDRWKQDPAMHIYHYATYEITAARRLMGKYATREAEVDELLTHEVFVDLYRIVHQGLRIGTPGYGLKAIEPLYLEERTTDIATGGESIVFYHRWMALQDGDTWSTSPTLAAIRDYNRDDCDSTWRLRNWLLSVQAGQAIPYWGKKSQEREINEDKQASHALALQLLAKIPEDRSQDPERWRIQELIAWLVEFHRREERPMWWAMFDRHGMTGDQLADDINCLSGLTRTERPAREVKRSRLFEYRFDPDQDTKIHSGSACYFAHDLDLKATVDRFDPDGGLLDLKVGPKALKLLSPEDPPNRLSIIPDEYVSAKPIQDSITRIAAQYAEDGSLPPALEDFLHRRSPRLASNSGLALLEGEELLNGTARVIREMRDTILCIQGPPGSGKTYTGGSAILDLLNAGKRVGVSANSHKAISKMMIQVSEFAQREKFKPNAVKIGGDRDDPSLVDSGARWVDSVKRVEATDRLIGGTAWAFSADSAIGLVDYIFVDEAGQVPVANLMGMAPSTRNFVLLGDQMQLGQPTQGSHPGESGLSTLQYLLEDKPTIPDDLGIFLGKSWRLHPEVCAFISSAVYEDRLKPTDGNARRTLSLQEPVSITKDAGLLYLPVEHDGNSQSSPEEVEAIEQIVSELQTHRHTDKNGADRGSLTLEDILIVAPYNMQVRALQRALGKRARVGTVDKFQGQEAPVVILSMASSAADASPRGIDFLLDRNRLNVAISRAQSLAIVVGHPALAQTACASIPQMRLVNLCCRILDAGTRPLS